MATQDEIRNFGKQTAENQMRAEAREFWAKTPSMADIAKMDFPPTEWIVPTLITPGLTTIAGQSKAGKSWLLLQMGLAVTAGSIFLSNLKCKKVDVLYLANEDTDKRIAKRHKVLGMPATKNLIVHTKNEVTPKNIEYTLDEAPSVRVVIIDTVGRYHENEGIDPNDYAANTKAIGALHNIARERDIAIILCTHTKKDTKSPDWIDSVIGSKATVAVSDTILLLSRKREETEGQLKITGRDTEERTIEIERTKNWHWYDKNADGNTVILPEFEEFGEFGETQLETRSPESGYTEF